MTKRTLIYIIAFLVVLNLSTIGTIIYHLKISDNENTEVQIEEIDVPDTHLGRFFRQQLSLTHQQHIKFRIYRQQFHYKANIVTDKLQKKRNEFMEELGKKNSDTVKLHQLSQQIGDLHAELKHLTFEYYLQMKSICNDEQQNKLYSIFWSMMNSGEPAKPGSLKDDIKNKQIFN
ncbi:MAG: hypothetical protein GXO47_01795 [Chlorobi bacterium]|nr:hypothetical protein [Chlorobiota bacterium]